MQPQVGAAALQPQLGAAAAQPLFAQPFEQPLLHPLLHPLPHFGLQQLLQENSRSIKHERPHFDLQQLDLQQLFAQPLSHPQDGAAAAQVGAAAQPGAAAQVGAAAQPVVQPDEQPLLQPLPQPLPQPRWQRDLRQQLDLQQDAFAQHFEPPLSQPQLGAAAAHVGAAATQLGFAAQPAAASQPHLGPASQQLFAAQPLLQPHPLTPSIRSSKSNAKLWVQRPRPSTNDPRIILNFIEPHLLCVELSYWLTCPFRLTRACLSGLLAEPEVAAPLKTLIQSPEGKPSFWVGPVAGRWVVTRSSHGVFATKPVEPVLDSISSPLRFCRA